MKALLAAVCAAVTLSGCVVLPVGHYGHHHRHYAPDHGQYGHYHHGPRGHWRR